MMSTFAERSAMMEESPNWLEMPDELMADILQRLGTVEILNNARKVCTDWERICKDPSMWKVIDVKRSFDRPCEWDTDIALETITKQAVDLSCGELIDLSIEGFCSDDLLDYVLLRSSRLNRLCVKCSHITSNGLSEAVKRVPQLEKLHLSYTSINAHDIEVIGRNCPQLKSFRMSKGFQGPGNDEDALAVAKNMPQLRHLQLFGNKMTNNGLQAILSGCPNLESLDVRRCCNLNLSGNLGKLCTERIKDFKCPEKCGFSRLDLDFDFLLGGTFSQGIQTLNHEQLALSDTT